MIAQLKAHALIVCVAMCATVTGVRTAHGQEREYQIKAAFLHKFANFVDWPDEAFANDKSSFTICILGTDPFGAALDSISGKTVKEKKVVIKRLRTVQELEPCAILFVSSSERSRLSEVLQAVQGQHVLTVGEMDRFAQSGGAIRFKLVNNKVRFDINVDAAQRAGLKISSKLLSVSDVVREERGTASAAR